MDTLLRQSVRKVVHLIAVERVGDAQCDAQKRLDHLPDELQILVLEEALSLRLVDERLYDVFLRADTSGRLKHHMHAVLGLRRPPPLIGTGKPFLGESMRRQW